LFAWTVDDADTARKLIAMGVTAITTNKPLEMRDWLGM
jgi:glycerophosphoryl diester phosphodiesterase